MGHRARWSSLYKVSREAVRARIIDELDYERLASRAQITPAAARQRVSRGLAALRARLDHEGGTR